MKPVFETFTLFSFRRELYAIVLTLLFLLSLPFLLVIVLTNTGIQMVSDTLVKVDESTRVVQILNPSDGKVIATLNSKLLRPTKGTITLNFGETSIYQPLHTGIDIAGKLNEPVYAALPGIVTYSGEKSWGYGKHVIIQHENGISTVYAHFNQIAVTEGQQVKAGDYIGGQGKTGWATGVHLHFEVRVYGIPVNPEGFLSN